MSIEQALMAKAGSYAVSQRARALLREEVGKGCRPDISDCTVAIEPVYQPILGARELAVSSGPERWDVELQPLAEEWLRIRVWVSPEQQAEWARSELLLKQLSCVHHRVAWEIAGNKEQIAIHLLCHRDDLPVVQAAFCGQFERCALSLARWNVFQSSTDGAWQTMVFEDFFPCPPYTHLLTNPDELQRSPYATIMTAMAALCPPAIGFYQVVFQPTHAAHDWHQNVQMLLDLEFSIKLAGGIVTPMRYAQQMPSGDLKQMALETETKAHNDKPFFAVAVRIGVINAPDPAGPSLRSLTTATSLFQHGGRPLSSVDRHHYDQHIDRAQLRNMFDLGLTHRPGFLLNSWELTSLVHMPPPEFVDQMKQTFPGLETLPVDADLTIGTPIGVCTYADETLPVCIPDNMRTKHAHFLGRPGQGKSTVLEYMALNDIRQDYGVAILDPHGRLVQRLLHLIPPEQVDRVIYVDFGDPDWVPIWNPLHRTEGMSRSRVADDLVRAFKSVVTGWGDRLEHLLRHALLALLHLPNPSLLDVSNLLRQKSQESKHLRVQLMQVLDNEVTRQFWREDFDRYSAADLSPPQHKLSKLLAGETVALMLSQADSAFALREVMDSGKILLVNLANVGPEVLEILGCFILSMLHIAALGREASAEQSHRRFHIYCDEAHRFLTDAVEDLIAETRKFNVSLTLAHQFMSQFNTKQADALSSVGSTIIFNVDTKDARHLNKDLQDKVTVADLITLDVGQAIARIGNQVVRIKTPHPLELPRDSAADLIVRRSRERYYRPAAEVRKAIRTRRGVWAESVADGQPSTASGDHRSDGPEVLEYDEL